MRDLIVLAVDDEPNVLRYCRRALEAEDYQVLTATSGRQALGILARQKIDLMLVDIRMPDMDGFDLLSQARSQQPNLAAVIMTGFGTIETAVAALRKGAEGLIMKPFSLDELSATVNQALLERERRREAAMVHSLRPVFEVIEVFFSESDLERLARLVVDSVARQLECSAVSLYRYNEAADSYYLRANYGEPIPVNICERGGQYIPHGNPEGEPVRLIHMRSGDPGQQTGGRASLPAQDVLEAQQLSSAMCVSILSQAGRSRLLAARQVGMPDFTQADLELFVILARQAGLAMENAYLYTRLQESIKEIEQSRQAMIRAEKMSAAGRLTGSIAHEINNPLQSLSNCLHLAARSELKASERRKYLNLAETELERLRATVQRMLDFYRPGGRDRKLVEVNPLVDRVLLMMEAELEKREINLIKDLAPNLPPIQVVDSQIQQVLINLILNAMEAMPEGGELRVRTAYPCFEQGSGPSVGIFVEDTGPGVPAELTEIIFEPFFSTKEQGTGLGLAVSYGIVSAHGGSLAYLAGDQYRSCFRILLPEGVTHESQDSSGRR